MLLDTVPESNAHIEFFSLSLQQVHKRNRLAYHSKSLYMIVKKTCKNRFTALINTANRYSHASPDIILGGVQFSLVTQALLYWLGSGKWWEELD